MLGQFSVVKICIVVDYILNSFEGLVHPIALVDLLTLELECGLLPSILPKLDR
jgi:hypothetical protein